MFRNFTPKKFDRSELPTPSIVSTESTKDDSEEATNDHEGHKTTGLSWIITGLFLVGDMAGGGLVALPTAMIQSGKNE